MSEAGIRLPAASAGGTLILGVNETWVRRSAPELLQAFKEALA
jgi:hypothetical protein